MAATSDSSALETEVLTHLATHSPITLSDSSLRPSTVTSGGAVRKAPPRTASKARRMHWDKIQWRDLKLDDQVVLVPLMTKADAPPGDSAVTPYWGGSRGDIIGYVRDISNPDRTLTDFGGQAYMWAGCKELLARDGLMLKTHLDELLGDEAKKLPGVDFETVVLPQKSKQAIMDAIRQVDNHSLIFEKWGFGSTFEKGTAVSLLFYGPPGTGKTLAAQAIAHKYGQELKTVSTADIETPEPGGAERNIKKAFTDAQDNNKVLLFDECDSLVSSRKFMGSIMAAQVNVLLTELERYTGVVVFTTNRIETLDEAFDRRLSLKLAFEMPNAALRAKIWARMFPDEAPLAEDVNFDELATVAIAGGHIKNAVLKAARTAANQELPDNEKKITQAILIQALTSEVESSIAFSDSKVNEPLYGSPLVARGKGRVGISRG